MANDANDDVQEADEPSQQTENPYLAYRAAKIARNQARLRELGLLDAPILAQFTEQPTEKARRPLQPRKRTVQPSLPPARKSTRAKVKKVGIDKPLEILQVAPSVEGKPSNKRSKNHITPKFQQVDAFSRTDTLKAKLSATSAAREIYLDADKLLFGAKGLLGRTLSSFGKASVMEASAKLAAQPSQLPADGHISFNKYSGVQDWANCLFLWVNFGAPGNQINNEFFDSGRQVTWFGGSKMHHESPAICKLRQSQEQLKKKKYNVILWCRQYLRETKAFGSYTCMGRLDLVSYDRHTQPLEFVWKLVDYDHITKVSDDRYHIVAMISEFASSGAFL
jgi:hypothetical protein